MNGELQQYIEQLREYGDIDKVHVRDDEEIITVMKNNEAMGLGKHVTKKFLENGYAILECGYGKIMFGRVEPSFEFSDE
ncbi:hypothetical protein [Natrinema sp. DC36]|uniref:hypothetical protein n=1 Tax=Natrinema sp. DC36 TaxID=2878680 RepID=UPI001CF0198E|nr:hypothetical protein [Natrinema sp. DC36]